MVDGDRLHGWLVSPVPPSGTTPLFLDMIVQGTRRSGAPDWLDEGGLEMRLVGKQVARIESASEPLWGRPEGRPHSRLICFTPARGPQILQSLWAVAG